MANFLSYLRTTGDRESKVWVFRDDVPSKFLPHPFSSGDESFRIQIIDLFGGRHPLLVNHDALTGEEVQILFRPTVILDSNVVSYLHQYVTAQPVLDGERRQAVRELLRFVITSRLDYNPFFYYMEAASRGEQPSLLSHAEKTSESILRLHTMDERHFLATGRVRTDPRLLDEYREEYGVADFSELASLYARQMIGPADFRMEWISKLTYAALLKTAMIHKASNRAIPAKYEQLRIFMEETLNIALGVERLLAIEYFAGRFDDFIPVQRGAASDRVLRRVRSAAWDLSLLNLPPFMLVANFSEGVCLSFICTSDRALKLIGSACRIEGVMAWAPKIDVPVPVMTYDLSVLESHIGSDDTRRIGEIDSSWQRSRLPRLFACEKHVSFETLEDLTKELEQQVVAYCKS